MAASALQVARRAFVKVLLGLALLYGLTLNITRESSDHEINQAFKKVARKTRPVKAVLQQTPRDTALAMRGLTCSRPRGRQAHGQVQAAMLADRNIARSFRKVCQQVIARRGGAGRG